MLNHYYGIYQAVVTNINDPEKRGRIRVQCPTVLGASVESSWCDPCVPVAYDNGGDFCLPKLKETVWLLFIEGNVNKPVYLGGWWSINKTPLGENYGSSPDLRIISYEGASISFTKNQSGKTVLSLNADYIYINGVPFPNENE